MRSSEVSRIFEDLHTKGRSSSRPISVDFTDIVGLVDGSINLSGPITVVCGLNGAGKSTMLALLRRALVNKEKDLRNYDFDRTCSGKIKVNFLLNGQEDSIEIVNGVPILQPKQIPNAVFIDAPSLASASQSFFRFEVGSVEDTLNGIDASYFSPADLAISRYVTGKMYEKVSIFEVDGPIYSHLFVAVEERGCKYDIRNMSLGELSCILLIYILSKTEKNSFAMIDEPETYISLSAQSSLMDYFASLSISKKLTFFVATHSASLVKKLNQDQIIVVYQTPLGSVRADLDQQLPLLRSIGLVGDAIDVLVVEDRLAREFCKQLLARLDLSYLLDSEIVDIGGESNITQIRKLFPKYAKRVKIVGVYDGDQRSSFSDGSIPWPAVFLPGDVPIERDLMERVYVSPGSYARVIGISEGQLRAADAPLRRLEPHDWMYELPKALGWDFEPFTHAVLEAWLEEPANAAAAASFVADLKRAART